MVIEDAGLSTDALTWAIFAAMTALWVFTARFCGKREDGWLAIPTSLLGAAWIGFALSFVVRFLVLSYDAITFGNFSDRLIARPASAVNETLVLAAVYWICLVLGHRSASSAFPGRAVGAGPLVHLQRLPIETMGPIVYATTAVTTVCMLLTAGGSLLPLQIFTPVALVGSMWVIPAVLVWWAWFKRLHPPMALGARVIVLVPGVVNAMVSPYREHVALVIFVVFIASVYAGRRYRVSLVLLTAVLFVLVVTPLISVYRNVQWSGMDVDVAVEQLDPRSWFDQDSEEPPDRPWYAASRRFHAFDSLLLTIELVPEIFPYSDRAVFSSSVTRAFIPRGVWAGKQASDRGIVFSRTIWGFDDTSVAEAAIAPSMPGDLFEVGGILYIVVGGFAWGLLLGLCDRWIGGLTAPAAAMALALLTFQAFGGIERDFAHSVSTLIQTLLVVFALTYVLTTAITSTPVPGSRGKAVVPQRETV